MSIQATSKELKKELKARCNQLKPVAWIGKNGITTEAVSQVKLLLKKRKLIKIKLLNSFVDTHDKKEVANELAEKTDSVLIDLTGFMVSLYKR
jgi:putative YhbY family RNA-binding protein